MDNNDFKNTRYASLVSIWSHQNTMQLQWPSLAVTTVLVVLSIIVSNRLDMCLQVSSWGVKSNLIFGSGVPLLLLGLGTNTMLYLMGRAKRVMNQIENEIALIEKEYSVEGKGFQIINHPKGLSGIRIVRLYLVTCLAFPITFLGFLMSFGFWIGGAGCLVFIIVSVYIYRSQK